MSITTTKDWYATACELNLQLEESRQSSLMSSAWARPLLAENHSEAHVLKKILDNARGIARSHGLPTTCEFKFATIHDGAAGCAGFHDAPRSLNQPFIFLCKSPLSACDQHEILDVYCGLAIHEASHILFTSEFYTNPSVAKSARWYLYRNLFEDERIEALARLRSPGFSVLLQATRHALIERPFQKCFNGSSQSSPDLDKLEKVIFSFIRCPHLLSGELQEWCTIDGKSVFARLRSLFPAAPVSEIQVNQFSDLCHDYWQELRNLYPAFPAKYVRGRHRGRYPDESVERMCQQLEADAMDRVLNANRRVSHRKAISILMKEIERFEKAAAETLGDDQDRLLAIAARLTDLADQIADSHDEYAGRAGRRFSLPELRKLVEGRDTIIETLTDEEQVGLAQLEKRAAGEGLNPAKSLEIADQWDWDGGSRQTVIEYSNATADSVEEFLADRQVVQQHSRALRQILHGQRHEVVCHRRLLTHGRIDRRQLAKGMIDDRVFKQANLEPQKGLAICLLVDESGSMDAGEPVKWDVARQVVAMFVDSVVESPVELEVYCYSSTGESEKDCLIRYCYGRHNRDAASIAEFTGGCNYDHQAILTAGKLFIQNTTYETRWMFVISDGTPNGSGYGGPSAIDASRQSVTQLRKRGIKVVNIAIDDYASEEIFGETWVLKFTELKELVVSMKRVLTSLLRSAV